MQLEIAPRVERDLRQIGRYIARDKPFAAAAFVSRLIDEFEVIASNPLLFAAGPGMRPGFRRALVDQYQIVYRVLNDRVRIERVIHGMRDLPRHVK